ncbi:cyanoexosortase A [Trichothermofontia sp.]
MSIINFSEFNFAELKPWRMPQYWLLGIGAALLTLNLTFLLRVEDSELLGTVGLLWLAIGMLLWEKHQQLSLESSLGATVVGALLIALVLVRSLAPDGYHLRISPFISFLGLALMASGFRGIRQFWKELFILGLLLVSRAVIGLFEMMNLALMTAKAAAFMLWYSGFDVVREGVFITLPRGRVEVYGACSGQSSLLQMLLISVLFLLMVPLRWSQRLLCVGVALLIGFLVNAGRVALLAVLVANARQAAFDYWHTEGGSLFFSVISVLLFGVFCWLAFLRHPVHPQGAKPC